ncbi:MAG: pentapeptide repeat-containing protein, partial [Candidatus Promineifilaceae bacterium]
LFAIPAAHAADCNAAPAAGVDWSGCDKTGQDFTDADLSDMILVGTDFTGSTFDNTDMSGSNLTGAIMDNIVTGEVGVIGPINANGAVIDGFDLSNNDVVIFATFFGASGTPLLPGVPPATVIIQCPGGNFANYVDTQCTWTPTAVTMLGMSVEPAGGLLPFAAVAALGLISGLFIAGLRRRREVVAV